MPLADAPLLGHAARRTAVVRRALALVLAAALATGVFLAGRSAGAGTAAAGKAPKHTIVVLDLSGSISGPAYAQAGKLLGSLAASDAGGRRIGLVLFSDVAQEALPPETKPAELLAYARYFRPNPPTPGQQSGPVLESNVTYPDNPWATSFSSGTQISRGLALARHLVARDHLTSARVLLVSDLFDADNDVRRLKTELLAYTRTPGIELRVLPVSPYSRDMLRMFTRYVDEGRAALAPGPKRIVGAAGIGPSFPVAFIALVAVFAVALGANELMAPRFRWQEPHA